jgi:transposase-like protein
MKMVLPTPPERLLKARVARLLFRHATFATCPHCARKGCIRRNEKYQCPRCKKCWTLTSLTWMKGMKLSWSQFWQLLSCYTHKIPIDQTQRLLKISRPTIYRWFGLFRSNLPDLEEVRLEGVVQMDEAYFGGRKKGVAIIAAKQQGAKKVAAWVVPASSVKRTDIMPFIRQYVAPGSKLYTDGAAIYKGIGNHWPLEHSYDIHRKGEFGKTSVIEGFWGSLRTFIRRMYHHVTTAKLPEMLKEYQCRLMYQEMFENPANLLPKLLPQFPFA